MGTPQDHRKCAEECVAMAQATEDQKDKALWFTLAQSWLRLAEQVTRARGTQGEAADGDDVLAVNSSD
jgi:putative IMPACT (imprinted ancient) family translation regulator